MSRLGGFGVPGVGALEQTVEREILWGGDASKGLVLFKGNCVISGAIRDAGNDVTTNIRPGLILGKITSSGKFKEWDVTSTDGSQYIAGIITHELRAQDFNANNADRAFRILVRGPVKANQLLIKGTALTAATDQYLARQQMVANGFIFDDDPMGYLAGAGGRTELKTGTTHTVTAADNGKQFFYNNAAAVAVTLPALVPGLSYSFTRTADEELVVQSAEGDNVVVGNDLSADKITITTAGQQIGAHVRVRSVYVDAGATLKWIMELPNMPFGTGLTGGFAYSLTS